MSDLSYYIQYVSWCVQNSVWWLLHQAWGSASVWRPLLSGLTTTRSSPGQSTISSSPCVHRCCLHHATMTGTLRHALRHRTSATAATLPCRLQQNFSSRQFVLSRTFRLFKERKKERQRERGKWTEKRMF